MSAFCKFQQHVCGPRLLVDYSLKDATFSQNLVQYMTIDQYQISQQMFSPF